MSNPISHEQRILRRRQRLTDETYIKDGVVRWSSPYNMRGQVVAPFVFKDAELPVPPAQQLAWDNQRRKRLADYCKRRGLRVVTPEELAEMRSTFGPGATVVDVISGQEIRL